MVVKKTVVNHWRYEDGWRDIPLVLQKSRGGRRKEFLPEIIGWHCWVYPEDDAIFEEWMETNMKGVHDCTFRFNSGSPMYTVHIISDEDATLFKLTWM